MTSTSRLFTISEVGRIQSHLFELGVLKRVLFGGIKRNLDEVIKLAIEETFTSLTAIVGRCDCHVGRVARGDERVLSLTKG
jgi:hypothetical protein